MTARSTYEASVATAAPTRVATNEANANTAQEFVNSVGVNAGNPTGRGVSLAADATIRAANATYIAQKQIAAMTEQSTIQVARDVLANSGNVGPR